MAVAEVTRAQRLSMEILMANTPMDLNLHSRIQAEYDEMPGMRLTAPQAARLFNLEPASCARILDSLVTDGLLWTNGREFLSRNSGRRIA